jgi:Family of unknown function (DUF6448)
MLKRIALIVVATLATLAAPALARAHCDTLDGPVVSTARTALATGKVAPVLAWVQAADEAEIRAAFQKALAARSAGTAAREVADTWFFETVVRVHRAGEGAPFTGLKPAGLDAGPAIPAADQALRTGELGPVEKLLARELKEGLRARFEQVRARKAPGEDVAAGRAWVAAYVPFVHYVEGVHQAATGGAPEQAEGGGHAEASPPAAGGEHPHRHP